MHANLLVSGSRSRLPLPETGIANRGVGTVHSFSSRGLSPISCLTTGVHFRTNRNDRSGLAGTGDQDGRNHQAMHSDGVELQAAESPEVTATSDKDQQETTISGLKRRFTLARRKRVPSNERDLPKLPGRFHTIRTQGY